MSVQTRTGKTGKKSYIVRWKHGPPPHSRTFDLKGDADAFDAEVKRRKQLGPLAVQHLVAPDQTTLGEWITQRWVPEHGATLERRTRTRYAQSWKNHGVDWLDDVALRDLGGHAGVDRLRAWQAGRLAAGVSPDAIIKTRTFLSSVLRHAAEAGAIESNPVPQVRAPRPGQTDEIEPLTPATIETVRRVLAAAMPIEIPEGTRLTSRRAAYTMPDGRPHTIRIRDATLVAVLAYTGMRPSEALALRWQDIGDATILVQRALDDLGDAKSTKGRQSRNVRLLAPLADDLRHWRMAAGRPSSRALIFPTTAGGGWTKNDQDNWRERTWHKACERAGIDVARPYDLRHSFASLLLAEHRTIHYVAKQLGHSPALTLRTYGHVMAEYEDAQQLDAEAEILSARSQSGALTVHLEATQR